MRRSVRITRNSESERESGVSDIEELNDTTATTTAKVTTPLSVKRGRKKKTVAVNESINVDDDAGDDLDGCFTPISNTQQQEQPQPQQPRPPRSAKKPAVIDISTDDEAGNVINLVTLEYRMCKGCVLSAF